MLREEFPIFTHQPDLVFLDSAATSHKPRGVIDALSYFYSAEYGTVHRAVYRSSMCASEKYRAAREAACRFLHAKEVDEIVFTRGTTDALNLVAASFAPTILRPGDEILVSQMEHHSNLVPWQMVAERTGAILRHIPINSQGILQWVGQITSKTKIVALAHISNVTGTKNPVEAIAKAAHAMGAVFVVDGAQAASHILVDVQAIDCDFYAFSGHKCYGPTGIGILYGKRELLEKMPPLQGGGDMISRVDLSVSTYAAPPLRFEAGTPLIGSAIALKAALDFIEGVGFDRIEAYETSLLRHATERMRSIDGLRILGEAPGKGPIIAFDLEQVHPLDLAMFLDVKNIAIRSGHLCAQPLLRFFGKESAARASFALYNTLEEVDLFCDALLLAARTLRQ